MVIRVYRRSLFYAIELSTRLPVRPFGYGQCKPGAISGLACFIQGNFCYGEDLAGEEQAKAGIFPEPPLEQVFFILHADPGPVVLAGKESPLFVSDAKTGFVIALPPYDANPHFLCVRKCL